MKLKHITFTGIDDSTNFPALELLCLEFVRIEFGVLLSRHWYENGSRYMNPDFFEELSRYNINLSCHICGSLALDALNGNFDIVNKETKNKFEIFSRCQINVSGQDPLKYKEYIDSLKSEGKKIIVPESLDEIIIQQHDSENMEIAKIFKENCSAPDKVKVLLDASGGRGIFDEIKTVPGNDYGYAGGIGPDNVCKIINLLEEDETVGDYWIDMESKVRKNDKFDIGTVLNVLNNIYYIQ